MTIKNLQIPITVKCLTFVPISLYNYYTINNKPSSVLNNSIYKDKKL